MLARTFLVAICFFATGFVSPAMAQTSSAQTAWRLLDYIAVDYPEAVENGTIVNQTEFAEMVEFSATAGQLIGELPESPAKADLTPAITHDWPEGMPVSEAELDVFEAHFGDFIDELLGSN